MVEGDEVDEEHLILEMDEVETEVDAGAGLSFLHTEQLRTENARMKDQLSLLQTENTNLKEEMAMLKAKH